jgi:hypothetical protein
MTIMRFSEKAIESMALFIEGGINAQLRLVETDRGLASGSLPNWAEVCRGLTTLLDNWPHFEVWETKVSCQSYLEDIYEVDCKVGLAIVGDADLSAGQLMLRRYEEAMLRLLRSDRTLGGRVLEAVESSLEAGITKEDESIRHGFVMDITIALHEPR